MQPDSEVSPSWLEAVPAGNHFRVTSPHHIHLAIQVFWDQHPLAELAPGVLVVQQMVAVVVVLVDLVLVDLAGVRLVVVLVLVDLAVDLGVTLVDL